MPATSSSPTVLLDALAAAEVPSRPLSAAESISLLQALATVPDPRHRRGRRHSLQSILFLTLGAIVAGARSYAAIADWAAAGEQQVRVCADPPHASTFRRLLSRLDPVALQAAVTGWVLLDQVLHLNEWVGIGLIVLSNVGISARDHVLSRIKSLRPLPADLV